jgi:hypothetical protein
MCLFVFRSFQSCNLVFLLSAHLSWLQIARQLENLPHGPGFDPHGYFHRPYSTPIASLQHVLQIQESELFEPKSEEDLQEWYLDVYVATLCVVNAVEGNKRP